MSWLAQQAPECAITTLQVLFGVLGFIIVIIHIDRWQRLVHGYAERRARLADVEFWTYVELSRKACIWAEVGGALLMVSSACLIFPSETGTYPYNHWLRLLLEATTFVGAWACLFIGAISGSRARCILKSGGAEPNGPPK